MCQLRAPCPMPSAGSSLPPALSCIRVSLAHESLVGSSRALEPLGKLMGGLRDRKSLKSREVQLCRAATAPASGAGYKTSRFQASSTCVSPGSSIFPVQSHLGTAVSPRTWEAAAYHGVPEPALSPRLSASNINTKQPIVANKQY